MRKKKRAADSGTRKQPLGKSAPSSRNLTSHKRSLTTASARGRSAKRSTPSSVSTDKSPPRKPRSSKSPASSNKPNDGRDYTPRRKQKGRAADVASVQAPPVRKARGGHAPKGTAPFASLTASEKRQRKSDAAKRGHDTRRKRDERRERQRFNIADDPNESKDYAFGFYNRINSKKDGEPESIEKWEGIAKEYMTGQRVVVTLSGKRYEAGDEDLEHPTRFYVKRVIEMHEYEDFLKAVRSGLKGVMDGTRANSSDKVFTTSLTLEFADEDTDEDEES